MQEDFTETDAGNARDIAGRLVFLRGRFWPFFAFSPFLWWLEGYVEQYNNVRLNSAIGYVAPKGMLAGHQQEIQADRDRKLEAAKEQRKNRRQRAA